MKIFAIVVTFNGEHWLKNTLECLMRSEVPIEIIVVDNGSTDNTVQVIKSTCDEVILIECGQNWGFGKANNIGIDYAYCNGADYIFLLNQDASIQPDVIKELVSVSRRHPDYFILSPLHFDGRGQSLDYNFSTYISPEYCDNLVSDLIVHKRGLKDVYEVNFVNAAFWLIPRRCLEIVGAFDPIFAHYGEDVDYARRVKYHGYKIGICPKTFGYHDRNQEKFVFNKQSSVKKLSRREVNYLIILMDIQSSISHVWLKCAIFFLKNLFGALFKLQIGNALIELRVILKVLSKVPTVLEGRNLNRKALSRFLDNARV